MNEKSKEKKGMVWREVECGVGVSGYRMWDREWR